ncbi:hypothetical protein [Agriterribacter sp.]|uniref:hypothetical protein n=1 Tax=Agriterribacter sp. TaxID=2821509 RepID=UPI002D1F9DE3|nr:hypothetical protein [Agriterribacter sp.]
MTVISDFYSMKKWLNHNKLLLTGAILGGVGGFIYWKLVGCNSGTCAITSNPRNSTLYFAVMGALLFSMFKKPTKDAA